MLENDSDMDALEEYDDIKSMPDDELIKYYLY